MKKFSQKLTILAFMVLHGLMVITTLHLWDVITDHFSNFAIPGLMLCIMVSIIVICYIHGTIYHYLPKKQPVHKWEPTIDDLKQND